MKKIFAILCLLIIVFTLCSCDGTGDDSGKATDNSAKIMLTSIKTPYCDVKINAKLDGKVTYTESNEDPYTLTFKSVSDETELLSVIFGSDDGTLLGTLVRDDENVVIRVALAEINDTNQELYEEYSDYQDDIVDTVVKNLSADYDFAMNAVVEKEDTATFDIKTSVVTLKYPKKWEDKVTIDVSDKTVKFSCNKEALFDIVFEKCDGYLLGTYDKTPIYTVDYTVDSKKYSDEEYKELCSMQENINVILENLMQDSKFKINN